MSGDACETGWGLAATTEGVIFLPSMSLPRIQLVLLLYCSEVAMSDLLSLPVTFFPFLSTALPEGKRKV